MYSGTVWSKIKRFPKPVILLMSQVLPLSGNNGLQGFYFCLCTIVLQHLIQFDSYLTEDVRRRRISGSANCRDSPDNREIPAASRRASSRAWVSWSTGSLLGPPPNCLFSGDGSCSPSEQDTLPPSSIRNESTWKWDN